MSNAMTAQDHSLLYLDSQTVRELLPNERTLREALQARFTEHANAGFIAPPKKNLVLQPGHFFQTLPIAARDQSYAMNKWLGVSSDNAARGLPGISGLIILNDGQTGVPLAVMDAGIITVARTAAMSALAAQYLARKDSTSLGFVGCGEQAIGHLGAMLDVLPNIERIVAFSRGIEKATALTLRPEVGARHATATTQVADVLNCDVIITSVPGDASFVPFLDARQLSEGTFVSAVDLGRSWIRETLDVFDQKVTDDIAQASVPENREKLTYQGPFDADLSLLCTGMSPHKSSSTERIFFQFPGHSLGDLTVSTLIYEAALHANKGIRLAR
jgi:alanine dehydrogenase